jgi:hypothetical protein
MDTETKGPNKLAAIRTYAKDLDTKRNHKSGSPKEAGVVAVEPVIKEPIRASDTLTTEVSKIDVPTTKPRPKKAVSVPALKPITPTPTKKDPTIIVDNEDASPATIITDTKRGQFKLIPAIINSISGWFTAKKQDYKAKKIPKYTVPDTTRRKGIIQKATSKTGKFASSDFSSIQERILERKAAAAKTKDAEEEPSAIWTANTEPGFALLAETTAPQISNVQVVARKTFRAVPEEIVIAVEPEPIPTPEPQSSPDIEEGKDDDRWSAPVREAIPEVTPTAIATKDEVSEEAPAAPEPLPIEKEPDEVEPIEAPESIQAVATPVKKSRFDVLKVNTNLLTLYISGAVIALVILSAAGYFILYKDGAMTSNTPASETLLLGTEVRSLMLYNVTADSIYKAFNSLQTERGTTQGVFMFTSTIGSTEIVSPNQIVSALELELAPDFGQTISAMRVGYINQAPYVLLKVKDQVAARGGLLLWEDTMYNDLTKLLSLAPEATDTFLDATIGGSDVRVLKNSNGAERLLYGIVSGNIIITTNSASYAQLTTLLK